MSSDNGDLVREATMGNVRRHVRAATLTGCKPADLLREVITTYDLNPVEARLAATMVRYYSSLASKSEPGRPASVPRDQRRT
jgi:hypothetical protein